MRSRNVLQRGLVELSRARHNVTRRRHKPKPGMPSNLDRLLSDARNKEQEYGWAVRDYLREGARYGDRRWPTLARLVELTDAVDYAAAYLKDAREQLCRVGRAIRDMPEGVPVSMDDPAPQ